MQGSPRVTAQSSLARTYAAVTSRSSLMSGPRTRSFPGYRYVTPRMGQVSLELPDAPRQRSPHSPETRIRTNVRRLGWPANPAGFTQRLNAWESAGILRHDPESTYITEYAVDGVTVHGVIVELDLSEGLGTAILPHEAIDHAETSAMLNHFRDGRVDIEPILLIQRMTPFARILVRILKDARKIAAQVSSATTTSRIWRVEKSWATAALHAEFRKAPALVADGHHRLASHLAIGHALAMLIDTRGNSLHLGAIHRVINDITPAEVAAAAGISVRESTHAPLRDPKQLLAEGGPHDFLISDGHCHLVASPCDEASLATSAIEAALGPILASTSRSWSFHHDPDDALRAAVTNHGVAILLQPPPLTSVLEHASSGRLLPEKATWFQPKPPVSMVIRRF